MADSRTSDFNNLSSLPINHTGSVRGNVRGVRRLHDSTAIAVRNDTLEACADWSASSLARYPSSDRAKSMPENSGGNVAEESNDKDKENNEDKQSTGDKEIVDRFAPGMVVNGRYEIVKLLGRGGMGEVYLANDLRISRKVALKVLHRELVTKAENFQRFAREAETASGLNHPHIMTVYEVESSADGTLFIVAEFIEGKPLSELIRRGIRTEKALDIASQIASALAAAHHAGIVHRDVKPENVMVRFDGYVKVLDFGLAKLTQSRPASSDSGSEDPTIPILRTKPGMVMGTAAYMSPEQARGLNVDARTDVWSLGAVIYEMITGRRPFWGDTTADTMVSVLTKEPKPISEITGRDFPELEAIVSKALCKNADNRYQSMEEIRSDLELLRKKIEIGSVLDVSFPRILDTDPGNLPSQPRKNTTNPDAAPGQRETRAGRGRKLFPEAIAAVTNDETRPANFASRALRALLLVGIGIVLALSAIYVGSSNRSLQTIDSVAVLPFENLTGDTSLGYLSDGISEMLIDRLSELPQLKVISRNSSFKFRGPDADLRAAASQLGVRAIVTGSIARVGDELNIRYEIIDAADNRHLSGGQFRRKFGDISAIQHDIAESAANNLRLKLTDSQSRRLAGGNTEDSEAYRYYLNGLVEINGPQDVRGKALDYFQRAVELDPNFAAAYAEIGWIYMSRANGSGNPETLVPQAREAIDRALSLDPDLAKAHVVRAMLYEYDFDWANAENEYRRAVELSPSLDFARNNYAFFLSVMGRHDEALEQLEQQRLRDPINERLGLLQKGIVLVQARRFDEAIDTYRAAQAVEPSREIPHFSLGYAYAGKGLYGEAAKNFEISAERLGGLNQYSQPLVYLAASYANIPSKRQRAREILAQIEGREQYASPALLAVIYTALGEDDKAIDQLETAYLRRDLLLRYIATGYEYDRLRNNPRFTDLLRRAGLSRS